MSRGVIDRRRYPRAQVPILVRPAGFLTRVAPRQVRDISLAGLRTHSDDAHAVGTRLELELLFPDGGSAICLAEVVWADALPAGGAARYEVGLRFVQVHPEDLERIAEMVRA
jgi:PilZ domain